MELHSIIQSIEFLCKFLHSSVRPFSAVKLSTPGKVSILTLLSPFRLSHSPSSGTNRWNNVHIYDLTELYALVFEKALGERVVGKPTSSDPYERFYFGSVRPHVWGEVAKEVASILFAKGVVDNDQAKSIDPKELDAAICPNSQTVSNRGFHDGWVPSRATLEDTLEEDVVATLVQLGK